MNSNQKAFGFHKKATNKFIYMELMIIHKLIHFLH